MSTQVVNAAERERRLEIETTDYPHSIQSMATYNSEIYVTLDDGSVWAVYNCPCNEGQRYLQFIRFLQASPPGVEIYGNYSRHVEFHGRRVLDVVVLENGMAGQLWLKSGPTSPQLQVASMDTKGQTLALTDGSCWTIFDASRPEAKRWQVGDEIIILRSYRNTGAYFLINTVTSARNYYILANEQ